MGREQTFTGPTLASPVWMGDFASRDHLVPGPFKLDAAQFAFDASGVRKPVPSGTAVGRTYIERDAAAGFGPAAVGDEEVYLIAFDVDDAARNADVEMYRPNSQVKENFLPGFGALVAGVKALVRARYICIVGSE